MLMLVLANLAVATRWGPRSRRWIAYVSGQSGCQLLEEPTVPIRVVERSVRSVTASLRMQSVNAACTANMVEHSAGVVERLTHLHPAFDELGTCCLQIGHYEVEVLRRARRGRCEALAEDNGASLTGGRELYDAKLITRDKVQVESPTQIRVKTLGAIHVGDRNDNHLELHVGASRSGVFLGESSCI